MHKSFQIRWSKVAVADLDEIVDYIAQEDSPHAAAAVYDQLMAKVDSLSAYPERGRVIPELRDIGVTVYRELVVAPYRICFRIDRDAVVLVGILDSRRDLERLLIERVFRGHP